MENYFQLQMDPKKVNAISNLGLAHIGDGVFELLTRSWLCAHDRLTVGRMHKDTISMVKATGLEALFGGLYLLGRTERINELFATVMEELYGI